MAIVLSDPRIVERVHQLADQLNQPPEKIIADAIDRSYPEYKGDGDGFWEAICGIGDSGDPDLAYRIKDILREDIDPIEGWGKPNGPEDTDRQ